MRGALLAIALVTACSERAQTARPSGVKVATAGIDVVSPGSEPRVSPSYETGRRAWMWRSILSVEIHGSPRRYAQTRARVHLFDGAAPDGRAELFSTVDEPHIRDEPHNAAAEAGGAGARFSLGYLLLTGRGQVMRYSRDTIAQLVEGEPLTENEELTTALMRDTYNAIVVRFPDVPIGSGAHWNVRAFHEGGEAWSSRLSLTSLDSDTLTVAVEHTIDGTDGRTIIGSITLGRDVPIARRAELEVAQLAKVAERATLRLVQTSADVLPGPGWPLPLGEIYAHRARCVTTFGEPGIVCAPGGVCCNPCLPGSGTIAGMACAPFCDSDADCGKRGACDDGVCSFDNEPGCDTPDGCTLPNGAYGRRCDSGPCVPLCRPPLALMGGTHCVKRCETNADCPGHYCEIGDEPFSYCAGLCPSSGCPYLFAWASP